MQITMKQARIGIGATQREIADKMGMHEQTYLKIERDSDIITIKQARRFADIVGLSFDEIFFGDNSNLISASPTPTEEALS